MSQTAIPSYADARVIGVLLIIVGVLFLLGGAIGVAYVIDMAEKNPLLKQVAWSGGALAVSAGLSGLLYVALGCVVRVAVDVASSNRHMLAALQAISQSRGDEK